MSDPKTVFWLSAHPEPRSLNGRLREAGIRHQRAAGHRVVESDLYALGWDPVVSYRPQFQGDYTEEWELVPEVRPGETGLSVHVVADHEPPAG